MKKLFFILSITGILSLASCELDLDPWQALSDETVFTKIEDYENGVRGIYAELFDYGAYGGALFIYPDVVADNLIQCRNGRLTLSEMQTWTWASDDGVPETVWEEFYDALNNCNLLIASLENFNVSSADQALKDHLLGEAYTLRALFHYELVKVYGKAYSQAASGDLGVPYMKKSAVSEPTRETVISNYDNIMADLTKALPLVTINNGRFRISPAAVNGILAQVSLEMGQYNDAVTYATASLNLVSICPLANFTNIWNDTEGRGGVFYVQVTEQDRDDAAARVTLGTNYSQTGATGTKSEYVCDYELYQLYTADDIRLTAYFRTSTFNGVSYNHIWKYKQKSGAVTPDMVDLKVLRAEEILLTRAEAYYRLGGANETNALADLNTLRAQRYTGFVAGTESGSALLDAILLQRRLELAFEGDRLQTLKRLGLGISRNGTYGDVSDGTGATYTVTDLAAGNFRFELPIPLSEMNSNPSMVQNPGY
ncbi:MAG: hypothetical protein A2W99_02665 [Bacteroidetes bacterium GWF2_33_16]|nr:MAG: hypothetical protein A2X00_07930 [Bacteroidetes bacterium GWE2_32_14]OFY07369.1 MAG: hypothetical protein A2W99_02665 [Bacteroidetes bacterium GWF2_33_16]